MFLKTFCARSKQKFFAKMLLITEITSILILATCLQANAKLNPRTSLPPIEIHGRVINQEGNPLQGASVLIAGTQNGTTTNSAGRFTLTVPGANTILEISSVGFQTKTVNVGKQTNITITLENANTGLNEVVVVGYGTEKKVDLTGAVSSINFESKEIASRPLLNVSTALSGLASGVFVNQNNGAPSNNAASIKIRGTGTLNAGADALVIIDGNPGDMNVINPNDIASQV